MIRPPEYEQSLALAQSDLNLFEKNIVAFHKQCILREEGEDRKTDALDLGSLIDTILLEPEKKTERYYVMTQIKATGKVKDVVDSVFNTVSVSLDEDVKFIDLTEDIKRCILLHEYQGNWKIETRIEKIKSLGAEYWEQRLEAGNRHIVSLDVWNIAHSIVEEILEDQFSGPTFKMLKGEHDDHIVVHKQKALYAEFEGIKLKMLPDFFIEDKMEMIIWPWDLKSAKSHPQFMANYRKYRHGRQGSFYSFGIKENFPGYTLRNFSFLTVPTVSGEHPEVYEMSDSELYANQHGAESDQGYHIEGWQEILRRIQWHITTGLWAHRKEYYESGKNVIRGNANVDPSLLEEESAIF